MSEIKETKLCIGCNVEKPFTEYWLAVRGKHERYHSRCNPCHSIKRRANLGPLKILGFAALGPDIQKDIVLMLSVKEKKKRIADKHGIKYPTFLKWCKTGKCVNTQRSNCIF